MSFLAPDNHYRAVHEQGAFADLLVEVRRNLLTDGASYVAQHRDHYRREARTIAPNLESPTAVYDRIAFAILSANVEFESAAKALVIVQQNRGSLGWRMVRRLNITESKVHWINRLPCDGRVFRHLKERWETWDSYRIRLWRSVTGLGCCKASFAACLLYPTRAQVACIDTWIQKVFLGQTRNQLSYKLYRDIEQRIIAIGKDARLNAFLIQWALWDFIRGERTSHRIFGGKS